MSQVISLERRERPFDPIPKPGDPTQDERGPRKPIGSQLG